MVRFDEDKALQARMTQIQHARAKPSPLDMLSVLAQAVCSDPARNDTEDALTSVMEQLLVTLKLRRVGVFIFDSGRDEVVLVTGHPRAGMPLARMRVPPNDHLLGRVVHSAAPVMVQGESATSWLLRLGVERRACAGLVCLCVPVLFRGTVAGALYAEVAAQSMEVLAERLKVLAIAAALISYEVDSRRDHAVSG
jgi:transcriptional regulator with GAF, ATPase, and Fis domain